MVLRLEDEKCEAAVIDVCVADGGQGRASEGQETD